MKILLAIINRIRNIELKDFKQAQNHFNELLDHKLDLLIDLFKHK